MIENPWLLVTAILVCVPLLWLTLVRLFPDIRRDIAEDGLSVAVSALSGVWIASLGLLKLLVFLGLSAAYIVAAYRFLLWLAA